VLYYDYFAQLSLLPELNKDALQKALVLANKIFK
jgi:hypothetical protein